MCTNQTANASVSSTGRDENSKSTLSSTSSKASCSSSSSPSKEEILQLINDKVKNDKAILCHVGKLGKDYYEWHHTFRVSKPLPYFDNPFLEATSKCPWYTVPLVWIPVISYFVITSPLAIHQIAPLYVFGLCSWPFLEYLMHRFLFHMHTENYWANTLHFIIHGAHHICPNDNLRLVFPPIPCSFFVIPGRLLCNSVAGWQVGNILLAGCLTGYIAYDMMHYAIHSPAVQVSRDSWFHGQRMHHLRHHKAIYSDFGISTKFLDAWMGTMNKK